MDWGYILCSLLLTLVLWVYTKEWLVAIGAGVLLWSTINFFADNHTEREEERQEKKFGTPDSKYEPKSDLFKE